MTATREQISSTFFNLIQASADFKKSSRRFVSWDQVNAADMPYLTMLKTGEDRQWNASGLLVLKIRLHVFVYLDAGEDPNDVPDTQMNAYLDAIGAAVMPSGADLSENRQTLGGLVYDCRATGPVFIDTGDIDGKGLAAIPFEITTASHY